MPTVSRNGFTLIEVLIALVIVAIGLLGFASLQMTGMQRLEQSRAGRSGTTALSDLSERINAMPTAARHHLFDFNNLNTGDSPVAPSCSDNAQSCTDAQWAQFALKSWYSEVTTRLPSPRFSVSSQLTSDGTTRVAMNLVWDAALTGQGAASCSRDGQNKLLANSHICRTLEILVP